MSLGGYAEYICLPEDGALALKPKTLSFDEAAASTNGALTVIPFLRDLAGLRYGNSILINGASGTVGSAAVQIAAYLGASVTGVCSTGNLESVQALGAGELIDYSRESFVEASLARGKRYDVIFDVAGKSSFGRCAPILQPEGTYLATIPVPAVLLRMLTYRLFGGRRALFAATGLRAPAKKAADLEYLREITEAGRFRPRIDRSFPLEQIAEAHRHVESGRKNGTVVITVDTHSSHFS
jgi:NADPH:quinone reductase-like Zn-dependent oxidoreductase